MHLSKKIIIDSIKVLWATIILTLWILRWTKDLEESKENKYFWDYITNTGTIEPSTGHETATILKQKDICEENNELCKKVTFIGDFEKEDKNIYLIKEDIITSFIKNYNIQKKEFLPVLQSIKINEIGGKRWYATRNTVVLNIGDMSGENEFYQVSTHELWHIIDLGFLQGVDQEKDKQYTEFKKAVFWIDDPSILFYKLSRENESIRKAGAKKQNFCSTYWMSDPFEDFAECFNLYINHNKLFKFLAQKDKILGKKYNFLASIFNGKYINSNIWSIQDFKNISSERVRDTTKIVIQ